jgi:beta-glucosidase
MKALRARSRLLRLALAVTTSMIPSSGTAQDSGSTTDSAVARRAADLLGKMTPDEKIGQLSQLFVFGPPAAVEEQIRAGQVGSVLFVTDPEKVNAIQRVAVEGSRLHIPLLFGLDVIHGFHTVFPVPIGMAASWDPSQRRRRAPRVSIGHSLRW